MRQDQLQSLKLWSAYITTHIWDALKAQSSKKNFIGDYLALRDNNLQWGAIMGVRLHVAPTMAHMS